MYEILVVGGAGYIGSHMADILHKHNYSVVVLDNLSAGHREAVLDAEFVEGDLADRKLLKQLFNQHQFVAVMHFAAFTQVGESVIDPAKYYHNNVCNTLNLLDEMLVANIKNFIFSSSAAVYGNPEYAPIDIAHPKNPINPYGKSKLMVEQILDDYDYAYGLKSVCLRYFNAAGVEPSCRIGEHHDPETHLIPLVLQAASGRSDNVKIFGKDYDTEDGTCVRDYIHVVDLCDAHLSALENLLKNPVSKKYNLGNGNGFSVQEVVDTAKRITGRSFTVIDAPRRAGDPAVLVADATQAKRELNWQPKYADLATIIEHAWRWERHMAGAKSDLLC
ncbi:MAG: UDP-glucose 4-epimerase GalE [Gammaproteobacteria bacterium]|jgi:UDP-glucose 4-epimerase